MIYAAVAATVDWSALPGTALVLVSNLLAASAVDYIRFRSVCSSWRAAAPRRPQLPWIVGQQEDAGGHYTVYTFYAFCGCDSFFFAAVPELTEPFALGVPCFGSSHGWLALFERSPSTIVLWNPVTGDRIQLPGSFGLWPNKLILSSNPATSSDCTVLLSHGDWGNLSFCRPGAKSWTRMKTPPHFESWSVDPVFFNGRFYVGAAHRIYVCDVGPLARAERVPPTNPQFGYPDFEGLSIPFPDECFLVESAGDLLLVTVDFTLADTYWIEVFRLEWVQNQVRLLKLNSLGHRALFVGRNHSFSVSANEIPGCKRNCIYMAEYYKMDKTKIRVIHMEDKRNELIPNLSADAQLNWKPCAWFTPNLL